MGGGGAETDVVGVSNPTGERQKVAVAKGVRPLLRRYKKILSPGCPFEPPFAAQGLDHMIGSLDAAAKQVNDLGACRLPSALFGELRPVIQRLA